MSEIATIPGLELEKPSASADEFAIIVKVGERRSASHEIWPVLSVNTADNGLADVDGVPLKLPPKELELLKVLAHHVHSVLSDDFLMQALWGDCDPVRRNALLKLLSRLSIKIAKATGGRSYIESVRGRGHAPHGF
jgi:DNA-binding response OmpR family regulator